jgi:hypothetical protein
MCEALLWAVNFQNSSSSLISRSRKYFRIEPRNILFCPKSLLPQLTVFSFLLAFEDELQPYLWYLNGAGSTFVVVGDSFAAGRSVPTCCERQSFGTCRSSCLPEKTSRFMMAPYIDTIPWGGYLGGGGFLSQSCGVRVYLSM